MGVMEVTLRNTFLSFKIDYPTVRISQRTFEQLQPRHICLRRYTQWLQCCCTYQNNNLLKMARTFHFLIIMLCFQLPCVPPILFAALSESVQHANGSQRLMASTFHHSRVANPALEKIRSAVTVQSKSINLNVLPTYTKGKKIKSMSSKTR